MNIRVFTWSKETHHRYRKADRALVVTILLIHKKLQFVLKDVLLAHIIPAVVGTVCLTKVFVSNLPFSATPDDVRTLFAGVKLDNVEIALRQNGRSKGFGFIDVACYDDMEYLLSTACQIITEERCIVLAKCLANER
jgi:hypothetical protein